MIYMHKTLLKSLQHFHEIHLIANSSKIIPQVIAFITYLLISTHQLFSTSRLILVSNINVFGRRREFLATTELLKMKVYYTN